MYRLWVSAPWEQEVGNSDVRIQAPQIRIRIRIQQAQFRIHTNPNPSHPNPNPTKKALNPDPDSHITGSLEALHILMLNSPNFLSQIVWNPWMTLTLLSNTMICHLDIFTNKFYITVVQQLLYGWYYYTWNIVITFISQMRHVNILFPSVSVVY